jgi:NAD(P)-dependent dehydrogenase (short-subunit alcohol dehydrogenase family)
MQNYLIKDFVDKIKSKIPLKIFGKAVDVEYLINFFLGDKNDYINGACINISGGSILD